MRAYTEQFQENFWSHVRKGFCWCWLGKTGNGVPQAHIGTYRVQARLVAYELIAGKVPEGYDLKRKTICVHTSCIKPEHAELVPRKRRQSIARELVQGAV